MAAIQWHAVFETGFRFIDDDHRRLLKIIQNMSKACEASDIQGCRSAIGELLEETKAHFHREEQFLQVVSAQSVREHAREHRKLVALVVNLLAALQPCPETGKEPTMDDDLIDDAFYMLLEDIIKVDAEFKSLSVQ